MKLGPASLGKEIFSAKFASTRYQRVARAANEAGGVLSVKYFGKNIIIVSDPVIDREFHTKHVSRLKRGGHVYSILRTVLGDGLLTANGSEWLEYRQQLNPSLTDAAVSTYLPSLVDSYAYRFNQWIKLGETSPIVIQREDVLATIYAVNSKLIFGFDIEDEDLQELCEIDFAKNTLVAKLAATPIALPSWFPFSLRAKLNKTCSSSDKVLQKQLDILRDCSKTSQSSPSFLGTEYFEQTNTTRCPLRFGQNKQLDWIKNIFYPATGTTGLSLEWALRVLSTKPCLYETLQNEIDSLVSDDSSIPRVLPTLRKCRAFIFEVLRLYPTIPAVLRTVASDFSFSGGYVPSGSVIITSIYGLHTNPLYWEDPFTFNPDRFDIDTYPNEAYSPFHLGGHVCPGRALAMSELIAALVLIMRRFIIVQQPSLCLVGILNGILVGSSGRDNILLKPKA